uniref:NADH dehydrogenase subunit 3 n=1 Tax=Neucentropus mandjuricus TaxID=1223783 RepID=UPI002114F37C|nr:NADH dehydrogenase subunit 3 [Neucentropus mandjuricus]USL48460.1 NADH dehydrogenase subunit 3 [Neucentropus mandjuricus]
MTNTLILLIILMMMIMMSIIISMNKKINMNQMSPFECGFQPISNNRSPFSMHFYMMTILFLIFDIEITIIIPFLMIMKMCSIKLVMMSLYLFMMIILLGLFHEWNQNILNWSI